jgi:predicted AlkP superfamily pyrophosphatase or phosphodiesterase
MVLPDYKAGSLVNLMASIEAGLGDETPRYAPLSGLAPSRLRRAKRVVLLVVDGLGYDFLVRAGGDGALHRRIEGKITSVFPSTTAAALATILTGAAPQQHALTGWFVNVPELGGVTAVLPCRPRVGGAPRGHAGVDAAKLFDQVPLVDRLRARSYLVVPRRIAGSEFNTAYGGRAERRPYRAPGGFFRAIERVLREPDPRQYVYAYWPELDGLAHEHGIGSALVAAHLAEFDRAFEAFLRAIAGSGSLVIVTGDHGLIDSGPDRLIELDRHPDLAATLRLPLCGDRRAAYCYVHPEQRDAFERYVREHLGECAALVESRALVEQGYFGLGPPHPRLLERVGDYTLIMQGTWAIKDWVPGERRYAHIGLHGGLSPEEMYVPLVVAEA